MKMSYSARRRTFKDVMSIDGISKGLQHAFRRSFKRNFTNIRPIKSLFESFVFQNVEFFVVPPPPTIKILHTSGVRVL